MTSTRSTTGCFACKTKRKKCDETKPHCLRCQKSRVECPGYTYIEYPNKPNRKLRTLLAPRTRVGQSQATSQKNPLANAGGPSLQLQDQLPRGHNPVTSRISSSILGTSVVENVGTPLEAIDLSHGQASSSSFHGSLQHPSVDVKASHGSTTNAANLDSIPTTLSFSAPARIIPAQASLLEALFSLGQHPNPDPPSRHPQHTIGLLSGPDVITNQARPGTEGQDDATINEDKNLEGIVSIITREPALDRTSESNSLPFVLQSYARWVSRIALDPLMVTQIAREFVFSQFGDGEHSRLIIALLANIGNKIGSVELVETGCNPVLSVLQKAVLKRLGAVKSRSNPKSLELVKALDSALETMLIHFFVSPYVEAMILRYEAAPVFQRLCPEPPGAPINLPSLLLQPLRCLQHYAYLDILFAIGMDMPTLFQYDLTIPDNQPYNPDGSVSGIRGDGVVQWIHGMPDQLVLIFAKIHAMRQAGSVPNWETVASIEQEIRELQPFTGSSPEAILVIMRSVVHECWRQTAYVYFYMAVCGDPCDTPRVKEAVGRYMRLLHGIKPGRLPDEFLILTFQLLAPAARRKRDREVIRQRVLGIYARGKTLRANNNAIHIIEDLWSRADAEGITLVWSDIAVSQKRVLGL